jgi:hypothetical protein
MLPDPVNDSDKDRSGNHIDEIMSPEDGYADK